VRFEKPLRAHGATADYDAQPMKTIPRLAAFVLATASACSPVTPASSPPAPLAAVADDAPQPKTPPEDLAGVDTKDLTPRERSEWWRLVTELYAPCADEAVSIAACVKEARSCAACAPAASLLADKVRQGFVGATAEAAYNTRFTAEIKAIEIGDSPARGPVDAPVTVVVWSDFQCAHCAYALPLIDRAFEALSPSVRLVHKFYPLDAHPFAVPAAKAAIAAKNQGRYWEMERLLFENQRELDPSDLDAYATQIGLDLARFHADMEADASDAILARDKAQARDLGLRGTPFVIINGRVFDGAYFRLDEDLVPWMKLEVELSKTR